jgi:hypothetical protein
VHQNESRGGTDQGVFCADERERYLEIVLKPKRREKFLRELGHFKALDPRYVVTIPTSKRRATDIALILAHKGAPKSCWVTSEDSRIDGKDMPLDEALRMIVGYGMGTFLSCIPGKLAYFEDEEVRWILERRS